MSVAALLVAAGRGSRAAGDGARPKQYCPIGGVPMLARTAEAFLDHPQVDDVLVVIHPDDEALYRSAVGQLGERLLAPVAGGARRQDSVRAGLEALAARQPGRVLIHDAARPFADAALIARVIGGLADHAGALPCLPVIDTLKRSDGTRIVGTVSREGLWRAQTPQGFVFDRILEAHRAAAQDPTLSFTDDAAVAEWYGIDVALVEGAEHNRKVTTAEDLKIADETLRAERGMAAGAVRVASGYDVPYLGTWRCGDPVRGQHPAYEVASGP